MQKKRFVELDFFRGLAIIGMVVFHYLFILMFIGAKDYKLYEGGFLLLARSVQFTFITLAGISMAISWNLKKSKTRQVKRGLKVLLCAALVSLGSYLILPDYFIRFGILHMIGTSIILLTPLVHKKYIHLLIAPAIYLGSFFHTPMNTFESFWYATGIDGWNKYYTLDYFSLMPWAALVSLGIFLGHILYEKNLLSTKMPKAIAPINFLGRHSLLIYMIHPIILILIIALSYSPSSLQ